MRNALLISLVLLPTLATAQISVLQVSPTSLVFITGAGQKQPLAQDVSIRNAGSGALQWRAAADAAWIRVSPESGTGSGVVTIGIDAARLAAGRHAGRVVIDAGDADDSPTTVTITAEIGSASRASAPPVTAPNVALIVTAGSTAPATSTFALDGPGGSKTDWQVIADRPWLSADPATGTTPSTVTIRADGSTLAPGDYESSLRFLNAAGDMLLVVPVSLRVGATAGGAATADSAAAVARPDQAVPLAIDARALPPATRNLPYAQAIPIKGGKPPYAIRLVQGRLPPGLVLANGAISGMTRFPGNFPLTVMVADSSTPPATITLALTLRVIILQQDTALIVDPPALNLLVSGAQRTQRARIGIGSGRQQLDWRATSDAKWLKVAPTEGVSPGIIQLEASAEGLAPGAYVATITVTMEGAPNNPARIPVQLVVRR